MSDVELNVPEIHCNHCKSSIESAVGAIPGVGAVDVAVDTRSVAVNYDGDEGTYAGILKAIKEQGYTVAS